MMLERSMIDVLSMLSLIALIAVAIYMLLRCNHYYGVPHSYRDEDLQVCYKCGKIRRIRK